MHGAQDRAHHPVDDPWLRIEQRLELLALEAQHPRVVGIKEATANLQQQSEVIAQCPPGFVLLSGDDFTVVPTLSIGGKMAMPAIKRPSPPLTVTGRVRTITDGSFRNRGPMGAGVLHSMGPSVVLDTGKAEIALISEHVEPYDLNSFLSLGIDPARTPVIFPTRGNVGPASIPFALAMNADTFETGHRIACMGIGSGLNSAVIEIAW